MFNSGFSSQHFMTLVLEIIENVMILCDILCEYDAKADMFASEETTLNLTMDVLRRVVL